MPTAPTPIVNITTPVPITADPNTFDTRADLAWTELPVAIDGVNAAAATTYENAVEVFEAATEIAAAVLVSADAAGFVATSNSLLAVNAGTKTIHFDAAKPKLAVETYQVAIVLASDNSIRMIGNVDTVVDSDDITVEVVTSGVSGAGSYSGPWLIIAGAFLGTGATAAEMWAGDTDVAAVSPLSLTVAAEFQTLTDAATIAWDTATQGFNAKVTLTASHTIGAPTNMKDGLIYVLDIDPATFTASWHSIWDFGAIGAPVLPANAWSKVTAQYNEARNKLEAAGVWRGA